MTDLALLAVLPFGASRFLSEPGTVPVPVGDLLGLCAPAPDFTTAEGARVAVAAQHALLTRVALAHDLVPVRPGAIFSNSGRVAEHLHAARGDLAARLARIAGCLELVLSVRAVPGAPMPPESPGLDGLAYLRARRPVAAPPASDRVESAAAAQILSDVVAACGPGQTALGRSSADPDEAEATLLVPRARLAAVLSAIAAAEASRSREAQVGVRGPWPCYVFSATEVCHAAP